MKGAKAVIDLKGVSKIYRRGTREVKALDGVDLHIDRGEYVVVEGPSGSGKTTLLFTAAGLVRPTAGSVVVDEVELVGRTPAELAELRKENYGFVRRHCWSASALPNVRNITPRS